jgi:hypothetical protein
VVAGTEVMPVMVAPSANRGKGPPSS